MLIARAEQESLLGSSPSLSLGDVATCNLTMMAGGSQVTGHFNKSKKRV